MCLFYLPNLIHQDCMAHIVRYRRIWSSRREKTFIYFCRFYFYLQKVRWKKTSGVVAEILDVPKSNLLLFYQFSCSDGFGPVDGSAALQLCSKEESHSDSCYVKLSNGQRFTHLSFNFMWNVMCLMECYNEITSNFILFSVAEWVESKDLIRFVHSSISEACELRFSIIKQ